MNESIKQIQAALHTLGYNAGPVDGLWGAKTAAALQDLIAHGGPAAAPPTAAGKARIYQGSALVDEIIIHCTATDPNWMANAPLSAKIAEITNWHKQRGFRTIGYHWVIDRNGDVLPGRKETEIGAHVASKNTGTIGISLVGGLGSNENDAFSTHYTLAQANALRGLIAAIKARTPITKISGHNEYAQKACPGFNVKKWIQA